MAAATRDGASEGVSTGEPADGPGVDAVDPTLLCVTGTAASFDVHERPMTMRANASRGALATRELSNVVESATRQTDHGRVQR
jgi:hypothetical protein